MSCSHSGTAHCSFMRSRMHSRMALKLFSLGLRRITTFTVLYTSSAPVATLALASSWYCAVSSATVTVRRLPAGGPCSSALTRPVKSFISLPCSSRISTSSQPRTYFSPARSSAGRASSPSRTSSGGTMLSKKSTSCCLSWSHSKRASPNNPLVSITMSASTCAGLVSPTFGLLTSVTANDLVGSAMRAQPLKPIASGVSSSPSTSTGLMRRSTSRMSSRIS
mmetsp:Transcript_13354/g.25632  ORF Transcript_13354/g.25632 Transcript_13354/m.25632 type:complete len:222 (+) Transcript_13354:2556-3221(+)